MKPEFKTLATDFKATGERTFAGYAACFNNIDSYGDIIVPGAFKSTLPSFLEDGFIGGLNHNWNKPIGKPTAAEEDKFGLHVDGKLVKTDHADEVHTLMAEKVIKKMSIGFITTGREWLDTPEDVVKYWAGVGYSPSEQDIARSKYGARLLTAIKLFECCPVTVSANDLASIESVKGQERASLSLDTHSIEVLATLDEYVERLSDIAKKRAENGRSLSSHAVVTARKIADQLNQILLAGAEGSADTKAAIHAIWRQAQIQAAILSG